MSCFITDGIALDCMDSLGGVKTAWILGGTVSSVTIDGSDEITGITGSGTFYKFELPKDTANFVETDTIAPTNGTVFYSQALTLQFHKMETAKRNQIKLLAKNRDLKVIFQDNNDNYWFVGLTRGAQMTAGTANTGTAPGDANNYSITLTADEPAPAYQLSAAPSSIVSGITVE